MPKQIWLLVIATAINVTGASFIWPLNVIYMHNELGQSLAFAGFILMINQGMAVVGNLVGGTLFDKLGGYKTIISGTSIALSAAILLTIFHTIVPYAILLALIGLGSGITRPAMFALASSVWPEGGRKTFNSLYVAQNLGVALGASLGGFIAFYSFSYIFIANALLFTLFFLIVILTFKPLDEKHDAHAFTNVLEQHKQVKDKRAFYSLCLLGVGFFICWVSYVQWQSTISSYTQELSIPINQYALLWTINGGLIILGQPLVKMVARYIPSPKTHIYIGNTIFFVSFCSLLTADTFTAFAIAMIILTFGEMLIWPAVPTLADELAPKGRKGFYQGFINSVATGGRMVGPVLGGLVVDLSNIHVLFYGLLLLILIPFVTTFYYDRLFKQRARVAHVYSK